MAANLNRRAAIRGLGLALAAGWAMPVVAAPAPGEAPLTWTPKALSASQARVLDVVAELIVPATDTPGAREAGVPQFVDRAVADFCTPADAQAIRSGLDRIDADARAAHGAAFTAIGPAQQTALLARYDAEKAAPPAPVGRGDTETGLSNRTPGPPPSPPFFRLLRDLVTVGYFTSEVGATKALRYDPIPGDYKGCIPLSQIGRAWAT